MLKIGLLGLGQQALRRHVPAWIGIGMELSAVYDTQKTALAEFEKEYKTLYTDRPIPILCDSFDSFIKSIDIADVVVPPTRHSEVLTKLIRAQKMFICEKPFCTSYLQALDMQESIISMKGQGAYLENWIFDPVVTNIQGVIASGQVGELQRISVVFPNAGLALYPKQSPWRGQRPAGGALLDWGSHATGLAWHLAGEESILVQGKALDIRTSQKRTLVSGRFHNSQVEDIAQFELILKTDQNRFILVNIDSSWNCPWMWSPGYSYHILTIDGSYGSAAISVTNTEQGRRYSMIMDDLHGKQETIDLGLLKRYDPTASALLNAVKSLTECPDDHPESDIELAVNVQLALGLIQYSTLLGNRTVTTDQFKSWIKGFKSKYQDPARVWEEMTKS